MEDYDLFFRRAICVFGIPLIGLMICYFLLRKRKHGIRIFLVMSASYILVSWWRYSKLRTITAGNFNFGPLADFPGLFYGGLILLVVFSICYRIFAKALPDRERILENTNES